VFVGKRLGGFSEPFLGFFPVGLDLVVVFGKFAKVLNHPLTPSFHEGERVLFALTQKKEPKTKVTRLLLLVAVMPDSVGCLELGLRTLGLGLSQNG
jgi:hypothetical protein